MSKESSFFRTSASIIPSDENISRSKPSDLAADSRSVIPGRRPALADLSTSSRIPSLASGAGISSMSIPASSSTSSSSYFFRSRTSTTAPVVPAGARGVSATVMSSFMTSTEPEKASLTEYDPAESKDPLHVPDYARLVMSHYRTEEMTRTPSSSYMTMQPSINERMRAKLIDWLVEVQVYYKLMPETLHLAINILDRYLEKRSATPKNLQLVGATALFLASKYEEIYPPEIRDFLHVTKNFCSRGDMLAMEASILDSLSFRITVPTAYTFLNRYLHIAGADARTQSYSIYLCERLLQEYSMLKFFPSLTAAAVLNVALRTVGHSLWTSELTRRIGYDESSLRTAIKEIETIMASAATASLQAVRKKFNAAKYHEVSVIPVSILP